MRAVASLGHVAIGIAAGRLHAGTDHPRLAPTLAFTALAAFADVDVFARQLGALRGSPWLHRGALHSLLVAAAVGIAVALVAGGLGRSRCRMGAMAVLVAASHGAIDAFTSGGGGVMVLWPASAERFLSPLHLLPASPIALSRFASERGLEVLLHEAIVFSPVLLYALWPRPARSRPPPAPSALPGALSR